MRFARKLSNDIGFGENEIEQVVVRDKFVNRVFNRVMK